MIEMGIESDQTQSALKRAHLTGEDAVTVAIIEPPSRSLPPPGIFSNASG